MSAHLCGASEDRIFVGGETRTKALRVVRSECQHALARVYWRCAKTDTIVSSSLADFSCVLVRREPCGCAFGLCRLPLVMARHVH